MDPATIIYLDPVLAMKEQCFDVEIEETYDMTGIRNYQFLQRGVDPVYKPSSGNRAKARIPIKIIIDILHRGEFLQMDSDEDLFAICDIMKRYLAKVDTAQTMFQKNSPEAMFMERCKKAYFMLMQLAEERRSLRKLNDPNYRRTGFDLL